MTQRTQRYCILVYSVLGEVISYSQLRPAMLSLWDRFLHSPVTLHTRRYYSLVYSLLGEAVSYALPVGPVPALTSDPIYPAKLYPRLFGPGRGY